MVSFCSGNGGSRLCVDSSPCIRTILIVGISATLPPKNGASREPPSTVSAGGTPVVKLKLYVAAMLDIPVKCRGWLWRARAILSSNCLDTISAVVLSYAATARSRAMVETHPFTFNPSTVTRKQFRIRWVDVENKGREADCINCGKFHLAVDWLFALP